MIEIAFGTAVAGSLKYAKSMKLGNLTGGSADVETLILALDIGDISDMADSMDERKKLLDVMYKSDPDFPDFAWQKNQHAFARLQEAKKTLEPVRLWVCDCDPEELCGLYFICNLMCDSLTPLSVVLVPDQVEKEDCIVNYRSTGEIHPETFGTFIQYEQPVSALRRKVYSYIWLDLVKENAPLRVVINGKLIGVPEDFYDFGLRAKMSDREFRIVELIGKTLTEIPGVGDQWLFTRIQKMLQSGELIVVSEAAADNPYTAVLKRSGK